APRARGLDGRLRGAPDGEGGGDRRPVLHGDRRQTRRREGAHGADEGRRDPRQHGPLQRRDRHSGAALACDRNAHGARVRRGVHAREQESAVPRRGRAPGQPRRGGGPSCARHGHVVRESGAGRRIRSAARRRARSQGLSGARGDRQGDRAAQARDDGRRHRHAHRGAGEVSGLLGRRDLEPEDIVRLEEDGPRVVLLDQRRLPDEEIELACSSAAEVADAIRVMAVRGAPAIGIAAAYGLALAALRGEDTDAAERVLARSRPTAVNLTWALARMRDDPTPERARALHREEVDRCRRMAAHAAELFAPETRALTHCNAGGLATGGYGSAVGALRTAWERGLLRHVLVDETRPLLQGARLTAWELEAAGIPHTVIADGAAGSMMARGEVD